MKVVELAIELVPVPPPCIAVFCRTGKFPLPQDERHLLHAFFERLSNVISARRHFTPEVFLQVEYLANGRSIYDQHAKEWQPGVGLGVWPNRPPPELWTAKDFFKMALEFQRTGRMRPLMYRVMQVNGQAPARTEAQSLMLGTGMVVSIWVPGVGEEFLRRAKDKLLAPIRAPNFRIFPFYVPLLDLDSLQNRKPGELEQWLCGDAIYIRESPGDIGIILLATTPLAPLLEAAGAEARLGGKGWILRDTGSRN